MVSCRYTVATYRDKIVRKNTKTSQAYFARRELGSSREIFNLKKTIQAQWPEMYEKLNIFASKNAATFKFDELFTINLLGIFSGTCRSIFDNQNVKK